MCGQELYNFFLDICLYIAIHPFAGFYISTPYIVFFMLLLVSIVSFSCFSRVCWFLESHSRVFHAFADFYRISFSSLSGVCWFLASRVFHAFAIVSIVLFSCLSCPNQPNQRGGTLKPGSPKIRDMNIYTISTLVYISKFFIKYYSIIFSAMSFVYWKFLN